MHLKEDFVFNLMCVQLHSRPTVTLAMPHSPNAVANALHNLVVSNKNASKVKHLTDKVSEAFTHLSQVACRQHNSSYY